MIQCLLDYLRWWVAPETFTLRSAKVFQIFIIPVKGILQLGIGRYGNLMGSVKPEGIGKPSLLHLLHHRFSEHRVQFCGGSSAERGRIPDKVHGGCINGVAYFSSFIQQRLGISARRFGMGYVLADNDRPPKWMGPIRVKGV